MYKHFSLEERYHIHSLLKAKQTISTKAQALVHDMSTHPQQALVPGRVVLSNGHGSMLLYSLMHPTGCPDSSPIKEISALDMAEAEARRLLKI